MVAVQNNFFAIEGELKANLDKLDKANIRTCFKQASDPIYLAFDYIDSKPLAKIMQDFAQDALDDICAFVSKII